MGGPRKVESQFGDLFDGVPLGLYRSTPDGRIVDANEAFVRILGAPDREAVLTTNARDFYADPRDRETWKERMAREGVVREFVVRLQRHDGTRIWAELSARAVRNEEGGVVAYEGAVGDVTERVRAATALERRDAALGAVGFAARSFLEAAIWTDCIQEVLARYGEVTGVSRVYLFQRHDDEDGNLLISQRFEWVAEGVEAFIDDEAMQNLSMEDAGLGRWQEAMLANRILAGHLQDFPKDEQWLIEEQDIQSILLVPVLVAERFWGLLGFDACHEERDWTTMEAEALRTAASTLGAAILREEAGAERRRLAKAIEQVAESIVITDPDGNIQYVNPAFEQVTGYGAEEVIGQNPRILKSGVQDDAFYAGLWEALTRGEAWRGRLVNRRKDGRLIEEEATISPIRDETGKVVSYVGVKRDVTEEAFLERGLRQAQKMESLAFLAGGIAHDFNNVMGQILGSAEQLQKKLGDEELRDYVELILEAVNRGKNITRRMLGFSRQEEGRVTVAGIRGLLQNVVQVAEHTFPREIEIRFDPPEEDACVRCESAQLQQALMNLCINAVDAMPDGGVLTVGYRPASREEALRNLGSADGEYVCITVSDTGSGMDAETVERAFVPFYTQKPVGKGTGLGLYIVYGIAKAHDGWVWADSAPGEGTTVTLGLPLVDEAIDEAPPERKPIERVGGNGRHVLVVDDELGLLILLTEILEEEGFTVTCASDGEKALEIIESDEGDLDLVITDVGMPVMGGRELVERLRTIRPELRVLVVSGYMDYQELTTLRSLVQGVITKPFEVEEILRAISIALA